MLSLQSGKPLTDLHTEGVFFINFLLKYLSLLLSVLEIKFQILVSFRLILQFLEQLLLRQILISNWH